MQANAAVLVLRVCTGRCSERGRRRRCAIVAAATGGALEGELDVDECGKRLAGIRVLRDFEEVALAGLVFWVPAYDVELGSAGAGIAGAGAGAGGAGGAGAGGGRLCVLGEEGRGRAGVVVHGRSPGRERGGGRMWG